MERERRYDLLVFDWDGTLADSTAMIAESLQSACRDLGIRVPSDRDARYVIGLGLADALRHVAPDLPAHRHPELTQRYRHHFLARDATVLLFEGVPELLRSLRDDGYLLAVATGKTRVGLDRALRQVGLMDVFHATRCADESAPKPDPAMLVHLMQQLGVKPDRTLMIGDTTHDLAMAENAGVRAVGVACGAHAASELEGVACEGVVGSVREVGQQLSSGR